MRIVNFRSGLGNQLFFYLFSQYLKERHPHEYIYGYYKARNLKKHNGLEVQKVFDIDLPKHNMWSDCVAWFCRKLNGIGIEGLKATDNKYSEKAVYYDGWWQDQRFFLDNLRNIRFRNFDLDDTNAGLLTEISQSQSAFIHIRRGDYLAPEHIKQYGGICTSEYYKKGINLIQQQFINPQFFVFSNDISWVKEKMDIPNPIYVEKNVGEMSFMDMFLMSYCKGAVLANSSFSYWGAVLNKEKEIVVYPQKWFNSHTPDIFPNSWIGI